MNDEALMTNDEAMTKSGRRFAGKQRISISGLALSALEILSSFVIPHSSFLVRHSSFVIRHSPFLISHSSFRRGACNVLLALLLIAAAPACRRDMFIQPSSQPLERSTFFQDNHMASRPIPPNTVARGQLDADELLYTGKIGTNLATVFPFPITREVLERGKQRFEIYCAVCHDRTGEGRGMIVQRGFPMPPSYHIERLRQAPVGHFFNVMTHGYGVMYSYADRVSVTDRWAIAAYIRVLQTSRSANIADVPQNERAGLKEAREQSSGTKPTAPTGTGKPL